MSRTLRAAFALAFAAALAALPGCSNETSSTSPQVPSGPNFNFTFPATGTSHTLEFISVGSWTYRCLPHQGSGMTGTVVVSPTSNNDTVLVFVGPNDSLTFRPNLVDIRSNGTVRWLNVSSMTNHTVTR